MSISFKSLLKFILIAIVILIVIVSLFYTSVYIGVFGKLPTTDELKNISNEQASLVLSSDSTVIGKFFAENRTNISWSQVPKHLVDALVATEDKRFFEHHGYDGRSYLRVFVKSIILRDKSAGGGSTITQQLIKNLYGRNYHNFMSMPINKLKEAIIATRLEKVFTKNEILLLYLNSVPFGENVYGIEAAANRYFDKHAKDLKIQESAVLIGILKANTYYNPRKNPINAIHRRNQILQLMNDANMLTNKQLDSLQKLPLGLRYANLFKQSSAGYFVYQVKQRVSSILEDIRVSTGADYQLEKDGLKIYTSLDISLQKMARDAANKQLIKMQRLLDAHLLKSNARKKWQKRILKKYDANKLISKKNREIYANGKLQVHNMTLEDSLWHYYKMLNAAVLISEPKSARLLAWVGGNYYRYLPYDIIFSKHQMASLIKPLIYASALENGLTPCTYLNNEVVEYEEYDNWKPENYNRQSTKDSLVALWYALAHSMNLPTVDLYFKTGNTAVADMLYRLNLDIPPGDNPSISLGTIDASLYQIVLAYGALSNGGEIDNNLSMIDYITDSEGNTIYTGDRQESVKVINKEITDQITVILEKAINEGTGRRIRSTFRINAELAGKTGTSQNFSDAWFVSYTPDIVIGTWVGTKSNTIHFNNGLGSGSSLALPICANVLVGIEDKPALKAKYLSPFMVNPVIEESINCPPYFEKGLSGFIHRITDDTKSKDDSTSIEKDKKPNKPKSGVRRFFERIFGRKNKSE